MVMDTRADLETRLDPFSSHSVPERAGCMREPHLAGPGSWMEGYRVLARNCAEPEGNCPLKCRLTKREHAGCMARAGAV